MSSTSCLHLAICFATIPAYFFRPELSCSFTFPKPMLFRAFRLSSLYLLPSFAVWFMPYKVYATMGLRMTICLVHSTFILMYRNVCLLLAAWQATSLVAAIPKYLTFLGQDESRYLVPLSLHRTIVDVVNKQSV